MLRLMKRGGDIATFERPDYMPELLHRLLCARGAQTLEQAEQFLSPSLDQLHDPMLLSCMDEAVALIRTAQKTNQTVCVFGDYDVDGVCATAILLHVLGALGLRVKHYIPSRHEEGYGLNARAVREIAEWAGLLITVDCGVNATAQVDLAKSLGLQVLITDHHQPGEQLPDCALVNPLLNHYPFPSLCGAGVAFKLAQALDPELALTQLDLAALATVADVVPLTSENRVLVAQGLEAIRQKPRPGIMALMHSSGVKAETLRASTIAFQLAPRLNASGRLGDAQCALRLLTSKRIEQATPLAEALETQNTQRRAIELALLEDAVAQMEGFDFIHRRVIVLHGEDWNVGVVGLAASRLAERYHLPVVLLCGDGALLSGSCRSIPGVDIHAALSAVSDVLTKFGGHKQAAGLTLHKVNLACFTERLNEHIIGTAEPLCFIPAEVYDLTAQLPQLDDRLISLISRLEPFGFGNPSPVLLSEARIERARRVGQDGAHLSLMVSGGGAQLGAIGFRMGALECELNGHRQLLYAPKLNTFNAATSLQLELKAVLPLPHARAVAEIAPKLEDLAHLFLTERLYNRDYLESSARKTAVFDDLSAPVRAFMGSPYGTLAVATDLGQLGRLLETAALAGAEERFDLLFGRWPVGEIPTNAICVLPQGEPPPGYAQFYSLDAPLLLWQRLPQACFEPEDARAAWLDELPDKDALRTLYRMIRELLRRPYYMKTAQGLIRSLTEDGLIGSVAIAAGLPILRDLQLIEYAVDPPALNLLPMQKREPQSSPLFQFMTKLSTWRR